MKDRKHKKQELYQELEFDEFTLGDFEMITDLESGVISETTVNEPDFDIFGQDKNMYRPYDCY